ncbi:hypothetical protein QWY93_14150 [Echinicola jeungdonensis]|uniref:DUF2231 domain-containing protein n=1 Tax=Echinicola jeungdonensis TaxID=709343 RepID=A0ABV5JAZ7_9BACT|nr:hypothetical protein [Echinicola jeungdonensis]MDN3670460.1 hypothetical protein [Echinicola jeungdonensis]
MDYTYVHLLANTVPVLGSVIGMIVLGIGIYNESKATINASYIIFIFGALGAGITYYTGKWAEESIKNYSDISLATIEQHKFIAEGALVTLIILALVSAYALWYSVKKYPLSRNFNYVVLAVAFVSFAISAATAGLGFSIRHPEVSPQQESNESPMEEVQYEEMKE